MNTNTSTCCTAYPHGTAVCDKAESCCWGGRRASSPVLSAGQALRFSLMQLLPRWGRRASVRDVEVAAGEAPEAERKV